MGRRTLDKQATCKADLQVAGTFSGGTPAELWGHHTYFFPWLGERPGGVGDCRAALAMTGCEFFLDGRRESLYSTYTTIVNAKLRLTIMHDSHGSTREQAVARVLCVPESTHLLIKGALASMTGLGRRALEVLCGLMVAVPGPGGRGESAGTESLGGILIASNKPCAKVSWCNSAGMNPARPKLADRPE